MSPGKRQKVHSPGRVQRPSFHRDSSKSWSVRSLPTTYAGARKDVKQGTPHESGSRTLWLVLLGLGLVSAFCFPATIYNHPIPLLLCPHAIPPSSTAHIHPNSSLLYIIWFYFRLLPRTVDATRRGSPIRSVTRRAYYVDHKTRSNTCIHRPGLSASIPPLLTHAAETILFPNSTNADSTYAEVRLLRGRPPYFVDHHLRMTT